MCVKDSVYGCCCCGVFGWLIWTRSAGIQENVRHSFFFSIRRRHTRSSTVAWARGCVYETGVYVCMCVCVPPHACSCVFGRIASLAIFAPHPLHLAFQFFTIFENPLSSCCPDPSRGWGPPAPSALGRQVLGGRAHPLATSIWKAPRRCTAFYIPSCPSTTQKLGTPKSFPCAMGSCTKACPPMPIELARFAKQKKPHTLHPTKHRSPLALPPMPSGSHCRFASPTHTSCCMAFQICSLTKTLGRCNNCKTLSSSAP